MDDASKIWLENGWDGKIAGGFTNGGGLSGDKMNTLTQLAVFAGQQGMIWVGLGNNKLDRLGSGLGAMAQSDNAPAEEGVNPPQQDLDLAEAYGKRVAGVVARLNQ